MVWPHLKNIWHDEDSSAGDGDRSKKIPILFKKGNEIQDVIIKQRWRLQISQK